jgi:hypothetical protein
MNAQHVAVRISGLLLCTIIIVIIINNTTTTTTTCSPSTYEPRPLNGQFTDKGEIITADFDVSLTVHLSITLANDQLDAQIFNTLITILDMFRAISCSSSGGQIILIQHLVTSLYLTFTNRASYK